MEIHEVQMKNMTLHTLYQMMLNSVQTAPKLAEYMGLDAEAPLQNVRMSFIRIISSHEFVAMQEDMLQAPNGPAIVQIALARSTSIVHPQDANKRVHNYKGAGTGLPPSCTLRIVAGDDPCVIHMAALKIEVTQGEGEAAKTVTKNMYYGSEFVLGKKKHAV